MWPPKWGCGNIPNLTTMWPLKWGCNPFTPPVSLWWTTSDNQRHAEDMSQLQHVDWWSPTGLWRPPCRPSSTTFSRDWRGQCGLSGRPDCPCNQPATRRGPQTSSDWPVFSSRATHCSLSAWQDVQCSLWGRSPWTGSQSEVFAWSTLPTWYPGWGSHPLQTATQAHIHYVRLKVIQGENKNLKSLKIHWRFRGQHLEP